MSARDPGLERPAGELAHAERVRPQAVWLLLAIILVALNLRPLFTSVGASLEALRADLGLSSADVGLLTTLPALCMGGVALCGGHLLNRLSVTRGMRAALVVLAAGCLLRVMADGLLLLAVASFLGGIGIAAAQVYTPVVIKARFTRHAASVTAGYTAFMNLGASIGAALTPYLMQWLGGWRAALGIWCVPAIAALVLWPGGVEPRNADEPPARLPWRRPVAWRIAAFLIASSGVYVSLLSWTAPIYENLGWSSSRAGLLLAALTAAQVVGAFAVLPVTWHGTDRRLPLVVTLAVLLAGLVGVALAPAALPWTWMVLIGGGLGAAFPLALVLPLDYARTPLEAGGLTALGFGAGLLVGSLTPWVIGYLRDLTGSFDLAILALIVLTVIKMVLATTFRPGSA